MSYSKETQKQIDAKNNYYSYRRGWCDGAGARSMCKDDCTEHYERGYTDGYKARHEAMHAANERYGADLSIIRCERLFEEGVEE